ncbi:hypothetical protein [Ruegeria arenilitoris]|uniref:hypothetical protein n=1 Tax=Ruegeria arenilitoris TaxID=1173585 RepID=UPI00148033BA|nr:hypothetical protein [Ruegeria arenilitoris]
MKNKKLALWGCKILAATALLIAFRYGLPMGFPGFIIPDVDFLPKPFAAYKYLIFWGAMALVCLFLLLRDNIQRDISIEVEK